MNVLAVVSKAVFEKEARSGGALLGEGAVWPTALYASQSPHLAPLSSGGALFLVTVRPGDRLWLVGILEAPRSGAKGWSGPPNAVPIRDVTALMPQLRFASGKGITAEPGKLGMSLQTPRVLTDGDVALLRGPGTPQAAYAALLETTPEMQQASAHAKELLAAAEASGGLAWRLENRRARKRWKSLTPSERALLDRFEGELEEAEEFDGCELLDVIDTATGKPVALFALWPFGSGVVMDLASGEDVADVVQHYFDAHGDAALRTRLAAAYAEARTRLGIKESVDFVPGTDSKKPVKLGPVDATTLPAIRAMRARLAADPSALASNEAQSELSTLMRQVLDFDTYRPIPVRRLFMLTEAERELLELLEDGAQSSAGSLWMVGLPDHVALFYRRNNPKLDSGALARFLGRVPPGALDETIALEGQQHPVWCLIHDAIHGVREVDAVLGLLRALPIERRVAIARAWLLDPTSRLSHVVPRDLKELRKGVLSKETSAPQHARRAALKSGLLDSLGPEGEVLARALIDERAGWAAENGPKLEKNPMLMVAWLPLLCTALAMLARAARARGEWLDASHDALITALAHSYYTTDDVLALLALLPRERAERIACAKLQLIAAYPSDEGAAAARRLLETRVDGGKWTNGLFTDAVKALGERMRPYLVDAKEKVLAHAALIDAATALLDKAAAKGAKKPAKPRKAK